MRTNIARDETDFVGRSAAVESVESALQEHTLVTLVGPGGIGKTRLSREVGIRAVENMDEVWFVDMSATDHGLRQAVAGVTGVPQAEDLENALQHRGRVLLILDNVDQILDESYDFTNAFQVECPDLRVLATSRERINSANEYIYRVERLNSENSQLLFRSRAQRGGSNVEDEELDPLLEALDGYPLAIELAASRVGILSIATIRERLEHDLSILRSKARDLPERHRTMLAAVESSWELLDPEEREVMQQLSVFPGAFDLEAAESIVTSDAWVGDVLESLVDRSLLQTLRDDEGRVRFELPHFMRVFCRQRIDPDELLALNDRHGMHYSNLDPCPPGDVENLYVAARRVSSRDLMAECVFACEYTAKITGGFGRYRDLAHELLDQLSDECSFARALLLRCRALANLGMRRLNSALVDAKAAVECARELKDEPVLAHSLPTLGMTYLELGEVNRAKELLSEALDLAQKRSLRDVEVLVRQKLGIVLFISGEPMEAEDEVRKSWRLGENIGDTYEAARAMATLAVIKKETGNPGDARRFFERALESLGILDDRVTSALTRINLADLLVQMERPDEAEPHYREALNVARSTGDRLRQSAALLGLVESGASNEQEEVANWLHEAANCLEAIDAYAERTRAWLTYAVYELGRQQPALALTALRRGEEAVQALEHDWSMGLLTAYRAIAHAALSDSAAAKKDLKRVEKYWSNPDCHMIAKDLHIFEELVNHLLTGVPIDLEAWRLRADEIAGDPRMRTPMWVQHNHVRTLLALYRKLSSGSTVRFQMARDGRTIIGLDGEEHDFSRRGPLRRIMLALAEAAVAKPGVCLSTEELVEAGYPDEVMTYESGRTRIYAAIGRLRKMGLEDSIDTRDEGYLIPPEITVEWID